jgi:hypothetical protein
VEIDEHMASTMIQFDHAPPRGITDVQRTVPDYFL